MKEFFCNECRRHKKIELLSISVNGRKKCTACTVDTNKAANRTKTELCRDKHSKIAHKKSYTKGLTASQLKCITGEKE